MRLPIHAHRLADELVERNTRLLLEISHHPAVSPDEDMLRGLRMRHGDSLNDANCIETLGTVRR